MDQEKVKQVIINKIDHLPTLPEMIQKVVSLVQDERTSARDLSNLISYDQAITSRLLKVANSAYYGFLREVSTIHHAIVVLGFKEVRNLSLGIAVFDSLKSVTSEVSLKWDEFWKHSVGCSLAARIICKKIGGINAEIAFTASLLHDIGKLILDNFFTREYKMALEKAQIEGASLVDVERGVLGFTHADVGKLVSSRWKLPPSLVFPIAYHHQVEEVDQEHILLTSVVHLADIICKKAGIGNSGDNSIPLFQKAAKKKLCIKEGEIDYMIKELQNEEEKAQAFINAIQ